MSTTPPSRRSGTKRRAAEVAGTIAKILLVILACFVLLCGLISGGVIKVPPGSFLDIITSPLVSAMNGGVVDSSSDGEQEKRKDGKEHKSVNKSQYANGEVGGVDDVLYDPNDPNSMWRQKNPETGKLDSYAPMPEQEFKNEKCDFSPRNESRPAASSWDIPSLGAQAPVTPGNLSGIPAAPLGVESNDSPSLTEPKGATIQAGHVNYNATAENPGGPWQLSPWGQLHKLKPCAHIYETASDNSTHEYVVTSLYTVPQSGIGGDSDLWRRTGSKALFFLTCSGPMVGDAGGNWALGGYTYNLVVKAVPVS